MAATPLEGPTTGFAINALEETFAKFGKPKHLISDQGSVFTSAAFRDFLDSYDGKDTIVYGHWRNCVIGEDGLPRPRIGDGKTYGIDTIADGVLTAIRFPGERIFQSSR